MGKWDKLRQKILLGQSDANIDFEDLCHLLQRLGFGKRVSGSHHVFSRNDVEEIINVQPNGRMAKPYQVKQVRDMLLKHRLGEEAND